MERRYTRIHDHLKPQAITWDDTRAKHDLHLEQSALNDRHAVDEEIEGDKGAGGTGLEDRIRPRSKVFILEKTFLSTLFWDFAQQKARSDRVGGGVTKKRENLRQCPR